MGTFYFASRPKMDLLYGGLNPADQGMINEELRKQGIQTEIDAQGNVFVASNQLAAAQSKLALAKKLPNSGHAGNSDLEKLNMMTTPSVERERLKTILEGELQKSIEAISGVAAARVHLVMANASPFEVERSPASASITIAESSESGVGPEQARAIALLVQKSVQGLEAKDVTVLSSTRGTILFDGTSEAVAGGSAQRKVAAEIEEGRRRERELQQKLDAAFGPGNTLVMISVVMDFDRKTIDRKESTPSESPIHREVNDETMNGSSAEQIGGIAGFSGTGAPTQPAAAPSFTAANDPDYQGKQVSEQFGVNEVHTIEETAPGTVKELTVNVLVNETKFPDNSKITEFVQGYLGAKVDDPLFKASVTSVAFDQESKKNIDAATTAAAGSARIQQVLSLLPIIALVLVGALVMRSIGKAAKSSNVMIAAVPGGNYLPMQFDSHSSHPSPQIASRSLEHSHTSSLVPSPVQASSMPNVIFNENTGQPEQVDAIAEKVNIPLEQLKKMAMDRPDTVAILLKSWMLDERR